MCRLVSSLFVLLFAFSALALTVDVPLSDPVLESRAGALFHEIRCVVCTSETIADSNASVASDIRRSIREKIEDGASNEEIKSSLTAQYGDVILMEPPLKHNTVLLWFGPWMVLALGMIATYFYFRNSKPKNVP